MAAKPLVLIAGRLHEWKLPMTLVAMTEYNGDPIAIVKEKVERVEYYSPTQVQIFYDSGGNNRVLGTVAGIKAILDAA